MLTKANEEMLTNEQILECSEQLQQVSLDDRRTQELCQQLEALKWKKKRQEAIQADIVQKLITIGEQLDQLANMVPETTQKKKKRGKRKKKVQTEKPREEQIAELRKAVEVKVRQPMN